MNRLRGMLRDLRPRVVGRLPLVLATGMAAYRLVRTPERRLHEAEREAGARTPVARTAHALAVDRERCLAAGMDDDIAKPIRRATLRKRRFEAVAAGDAREGTPS